MMDYAGERLIWSSTRNSKNRKELNLFLANFVWSKMHNNFSVNLSKYFYNNNSDSYLIHKFKKKKQKLNIKLKKASFNEIIHFSDEKHLKNIRQLTFGGQNAEGYFR